MVRCIAILCLASAALGQPRVDQYGDPLPEGTIARFGTVRYRIGDTRVEACAVSPDGKKIVIETRDETCLWDLDTGRPIVKFTGSEDREADTNQFRFSSDGKTLINVGWQGFNVFDVQTGQSRFGKKFPEWSGRLVSFLPGESQFVVKFRESRELLVFDTADGTQDTIIDPEEPVWAMSASGKYLLGGDQRHWCVVDTASGKVRCRCRSRFVPESEDHVVLSDNFRVLHLSSSNCLRVYDVAAGKLLDRVTPPKDWGDSDTRAGLTISPDGIIAYLSKWGQPTLRRDVVSRKWLTPLPAMPGGKLIPLLDGRQLVLLGDDGILHRYDLASLKEIPGPHGFDEAPLLAASPDGKRVAIASGYLNGRVDIFDLTGRLLWSIPHRGWTGHPRWSNDGRLLAFAGGSEAVVCDARTGKAIHTFRIGEGEGRLTGLVAFSADSGRLYAAINNGASLTSFDLVSGRTARLEMSGLHSATDVSPDGRIMSFSNGSPSPALFDLEAGQIRLGFSLPPPPRRGYGGGGIVRDARWSGFSPDGSFGISWADVGSGILWDPRSGEPTGLIQVGTRRPSAFAFSQDGLWLVTGDYDGMVALWEVQSGQSVVSWQAHNAAIHDLAFVEKAGIVSSASDLSALHWDMRPRKKLKTEPWTALSGDDALEAYRAIWAIADDPKGPELLRTKITPANPVDPEKVRQRLVDLGADKFAVRETASKELQALGRLVEPDLRAARAKVTSEEVRARLDALLAKVPRERSATEIVHARAVAAMELSGSDAAKKLLAEWAAGAPGARLTIDAKAALGRLNPSSH